MTLRVPLTTLGDAVLPQYFSAGAAGMDLAAALLSPIQIEPGGVHLVPCGFAIALPEGYEAQVRPRSGLASKHAVTVLNAHGTIDSDYRGEVKVLLINHGRATFT
ncbi:MAG TPA: dUTP diphosphatase, partial [Vicinamibacterales bacterium]|nr:dUTP diphosphatase [Vicinamibacterales bacterium]